ncbi:hypothetical protein ACO2Q1_11185 [Brevundimonas sp. VNH65]|uniref:hypothetical protein n=1 Tax=Brevundimonas sp. VNH65 TaxID=3400917 RepID=UPI003BFBA875
MPVALFLALSLQTPIPADVRLETFKTLCVPDRRDMAATSARLAAAGWVRAEETDHPELAASVAIGRAEANDPEFPMEMEQEIWKDPGGPAGRYVIVNKVSAVIGEDEDSDGDGVLQSWEKADDLVFLGCGLWDFDATEGVHPGLMTAWTTQTAAQSIELPGQMIGGTWNVYHFMPGTADVKIGFIPDESPWVARTGFSGAMITMTSAPEEEVEDREEAASATDAGPQGD